MAEHSTLDAEISRETKYIKDLMKDSIEMVDFCDQLRLHDDGTMMGNAGKLELVAKDFKSFQNETYLNDNAINAYLTLIQSRSEESSGKLPKVYALNTYFYVSWNNRGYDGVKRWFRNMNLFNYDIIFVPVHDSNQDHWSLVSVDLARKMIIYYDSLLFNNTEDEEFFATKYVAPVRDFIDAYAQEKIGATNFSKGFMNTIQGNGFDCGAFICQFANLYSQRKFAYAYSQKEMIDIRLWMLMELSCGTLFDD